MVRKFSAWSKASLGRQLKWGPSLNSIKPEMLFSVMSWCIIWGYICQVSVADCWEEVNSKGNVGWGWMDSVLGGWLVRCGVRASSPSMGAPDTEGTVLFCVPRSPSHGQWGPSAAGLHRSPTVCRYRWIFHSSFLHLTHYSSTIKPLICSVIIIS